MKRGNEFMSKQKYNVNFIEGLEVTMTKKEYVKKGTKWDLVSTETEEVTQDQYNNIFNSIGFFENLGGIERITKSYTILGYIPVKLNSISPDKTTKITREFCFYTK